MLINREKCDLCGVCVRECEPEALSCITNWEREGGNGAFVKVYCYYEIDADKCTDCGACVEVCPMGAIEEGV